MDSDFEEDDVVVAVVALRLLKTIHKKKQRKRRPRWHGIEHAMFYSAPATGARKLASVSSLRARAWSQYFLKAVQDPGVGCFVGIIHTFSSK